MSASGPPTAPPRGLIGFLDALRDGQMVVGWAGDPQDPAARPIIRLMRGVEVLAECGTDAPRDDGNPGFRLVSPMPLTPQDFLEGRVRIRAMLPGRQVATTLAMTRRMRAALEAEAGWEPTTDMPPPTDRAAAQAAPEQTPKGPGGEQAAAAPAAPVQRAVPPRPPPSAARALPPVAVPPAAAPAVRPPPPQPELPAPPPPMRPEPSAPLPPVRPEPPAPPPPVRPEPPAPPPPPIRPEPPAPPPPPVRPEPPAPPPPVRPEPPAPLVLPPAPRAETPGWIPATPALAAVPHPVPAVAPAPEPERPLATGDQPAHPGDPPAPLDAMLRLAVPLCGGGITTLHLLVPRRVTVIAGPPPAVLTPIEQAAAARPALTQGWLPLRQAFTLRPQPTSLWRADGVRLSVEGGLALVETLVAALHACRPDAAAALSRIATQLARVDLTARPRRAVADDLEAEPRDAFFGVAVRETEAALEAADLFHDVPAPSPVGQAVPGLEAWTCPGAPLPWRVLLLTAPGLGGSAGPAWLGWWLRHLAVECVFSEALATARAEAVIAARPDLVLALAPEPDPAGQG